MNAERGCYMDSALIPCPWCGKKDVHLLHDEVCWFVWCNNDNCTRKRIRCFATKEEALEDWNKGVAYDTGRAAEGSADPD